MDDIEKRIRVRTWYSLSHITGPGAVLLGLCFGRTPEGGPTVVKTLGAQQNAGEIKFDLDRYLDEVSEGVAEANKRNNTELEVEAIRVVPDDYPTRGQVKYVAFRLAERAIADLRSAEHRSVD